MTTPTLPQGYTLHQEFDFKDPKTAGRLNNIGMIAMVLVVCVGLLVEPFSLTNNDSETLLGMIAPCFIFLLFLVLYGYIRECLRGLLYTIFSRHKPTFKPNFIFFEASCPEYYFDKPSYLIISLFPFVFLTLALVIPLFFLHGSWFWILLLTEAYNVSSCKQDLYLFTVLWPLESSVLVNNQHNHVFLYRIES